MNREFFEEIFDDQFTRSREILLNKATEYATDDDRLHNFQVAANLTGKSPMQALGGFMAKHTVSIYDMIRDSSETSFSDAKWDEKITDHINYLILLRAMVYDRPSNISRTNSITLNTEGTTQP